MFDLLKITEYLSPKNYGVYYVCVISESDTKFSYLLMERYSAYGAVCQIQLVWEREECGDFSHSALYWKRMHK